MESKLILVVSNNMDTNKKPDRNENGLIRLSASARKYLKFDKAQVEIAGAAKQSVLKIHQAFSKDIKDAKGEFSGEEMKCVGFVTSKMFKQLTGKNTTSDEANIWISKTPLTTLIGADPEFLLFDGNGNIVRANNVLQKAGKIGSDGAMIEIRPDPSPDPIILVKNMTDIFKSAQKMESIKDLDWKAAIYYKDNVRDYPVGGHIHLGNPVGITKLSTQARTFLFAVMNKIMDEMLSLPLIKLDGDDLGKSRRSNCQMAMGNNGYGYYGEWRPCDGRLEHRTLSGLWLMHPLVAECVLGAAKAISEELFSILDTSDYDINLFRHAGMNLEDHKHLYRIEFDDWDSIKLAKKLKCTNSSSYMSGMLNQSKARSITKPFLTKWYKNMKQLSTYKKYSKAIDGLYAILSMPSNTIQDVGFNLKENWLGGKRFPV